MLWSMILEKKGFKMRLLMESTPDIMLDYRIGRIIHTTYALGNTSIKLLDDKGTIAFRGDVYDWDCHSGSLGRNALICMERLRAGLGNNHGFNISIYGTAKINQSWPY